MVAQAAQPGADRDTGDGTVAGDPVAAVDLTVENAEEAVRLVMVARARAGIFDRRPGEMVEDADLAGHRAAPARPEHRPLDHLPPANPARFAV